MIKKRAAPKAMKWLNGTPRFNNYSVTLGEYAMQYCSNVLLGKGITLTVRN